ncbi:hypothetical protein HA45_21855 [Pantoea rodasii]|nr:hypothetical protein HA45_21855 [Pantoea rodasii]
MCKAIFFQLLILSGSFSVLFFTPPASAGISVYPMTVGVGEDGNATVNVLSGDTDTDFVRVSVSKVINPGTPKEEETKINDFTENDLAVTPMKMAIPPGMTRVVRLVSIIPPARETTWRVYFESVTADAFNNVPATAARSKTAQVGISIVWGALVHVAPEHVVARANYKAGTGELINTGTIRLPLSQVETCDVSNQCEQKKVTATVYPGMHFTVKNMHFRPENHYRIKYKNWITGKEEEVSLLPENPGAKH